MPLEAGKLNRRVKLQKLVVEQDTDGSLLPKKWVTVATVWAHVKTQTGSAYGRTEARLAGAQVSAASVSFRIRYREDVTNAWRVFRNGKAYDILQVLPDEASREYVDLACGTGANDG